MIQAILNINDTDALPGGNSERNVKPFSRITQTLLNWFVFFLAFPSVNVWGNSITFYLFIAIGLRIGSFWAVSFRGKTLLILFLLLAFSSSLLAPYIARNPGFFDNVKILIQYAYWIFVSFFFITQYKRIDFVQISKWIFWGILAATIGFYFYSVKFGWGIFQVYLGSTRNDFVFNLLCFIPISFYYIIENWSKKKVVLFVPIFLLIMLFTGGRSGAVLIFLELLLVLTIVYPAVLKLAKVMIPLFGLLFIISQSDTSQIYLDALANQVESINPRFANLLRGEGDGDLSLDKSWLIRKLMVDKGIEIFKEYPVRGIGVNNFHYYDSELASFSRYDRLGSETVEFFNSRSAHNSYIQILSEMGLLGLFVLIALIAIPLSFFLRSFFTGEMDFSYLPLVSLLAISMHLYAITALTGANTWMIIGLSWAILQKRKHFK